MSTEIVQFNPVSVFYCRNSNMRVNPWLAKHPRNVRLILKRNYEKQ